MVKLCQIYINGILSMEFLVNLGPNISAMEILVWKTMTLSIFYPPPPPRLSVVVPPPAVWFRIEAIHRILGKLGIHNASNHGHLCKHISCVMLSLTDLLAIYLLPLAGIMVQGIIVRPWLFLSLHCYCFGLTKTSFKCESIFITI